MMFGIKDYALAGLGLTLALSTWLNIRQGENIDKANVEIGRLSGEASNATEAAKTCSQSIDKLQEDQLAREKAAAPAIEASKGTQQEQQSKATSMLVTPPTKPGNDCGSARDRARTWLKGRKK